jgi:hypothetical protein
MAHIIIRGVSPDQIRAISKPFVAELANLLQCPSDHILLEYLDTEELHALRAENGRLKDELQKLRKAMQSTQQASSNSYMSSRLRDALRE